MPTTYYIFGDQFEPYGEYDTSTDPITWEYTGPDPERDIAAFFEQVEPHSYFNEYRSVGEPQFSGSLTSVEQEQYAGLIARQLRMFDPIYVVTPGRNP